MGRYLIDYRSVADSKRLARGKRAIDTHISTDGVAPTSLAE
jgi:hypothetical protein